MKIVGQQWHRLPFFMLENAERGVNGFTWNIHISCLKFAC